MEQSTESILQAILMSEMSVKKCSCLIFYQEK